MTDEQQLTAAGNEMSASFLAAKKRSDETLAKLEAKPSSFTMLTGDRPTGRLHLGHYFGSIRERVAMQERGVNTNIIIADYQVITDRDTTEHIQDNVLNLVLDYMAAGIDPNKTMMFTHSAVPAENQLLLPFLSLVTEAELHRNPTVKSEMEASGHALTGLLLTYPVHQACDILFCKANVVPIGKDNLPHVEITHASMAFDAELSCLYSSTRKNGYTMFPAGPSKEYLNKGVFRLRDDAPCALYALEVSDEAYFRALHRAEEFMRHSEEYSFNTLGLILCGLHIRWQRRHHYFCSQFVSEVLEQSGALALPKDSTLMHPNDYALLPQLKCLYKGRLADLPQRKAMELGETPSMVSIYTGLLVELLQRRAQRFFE